MMNRPFPIRSCLLALAAVLLAACAALPPTLAPAYALQDAQATATAASRAIEQTATAQADAIATQVAGVVSLSVAQTQTAAPIGATATYQHLAILVATATEGAAVRSAEATAAAQSASRESATATVVGWLWWVVGAVCIGALTAVSARAVIRIGYAVEARQAIVRDGAGTPVGVFLISPGRGRAYQMLPSGNVIEQPTEPSQEMLCRQQWRAAVKRTAQEASIRQSWSVNALVREGAPVFSEDTVRDCQAICIEIGAIADAGGNRGFQWVGGWDYLNLARAIEGGVHFALPTTSPRSADESPSFRWPTAPAQSKATQSKAKQKKPNEI